MDVLLRKIEPKDSPEVATIIRTVMPEFGASGEGFAINDAEVNDMYGAYSQPRTVYFVCVENGKILGGGGIAPLLGGDPSVCELKKMYFLPSARGSGLGQRTLAKCIEAAKELGFKTCYLETFNTMKLAMKLYEKNGFKRIGGPMGNTGHFSCDVFYSREI